MCPSVDYSQVQKDDIQIIARMTYSSVLQLFGRCFKSFIYWLVFGQYVRTLASLVQ